MMKFSGLLWALAAMSFFANEAESKADAAQDAREVAILVDALSSAQATGELVKTVVTGLRTELHECPTPLVRGAMSASDCIHLQMGRILKRAYADGRGQIDRVEKTVLARIFSMAVVSDAEISINTSLDPGAPGKGIEQPPILQYRKRRQEFRDLRKAKGQPETLDPSLAALVEKAYLRKMKGAGRAGSGQIGAEEYMAARFTRLQLNTLSGFLTQLIDRMNHSSGRIVLDQPDYASRASRVDELEHEVVDLASQLARADPSEQQPLLDQLKAKQAELEEERQGMKADQLFVQIQEKKAERDQAVDAVLAPALDPSERATRAGRVDELDQEVQALEAKLAAERDEIALPPTDVDRIAVKALKIDLARLVERGPFQGQGMNLEFGDVVMAAWISGEVDSDLLQTCLEMDALGEPRESILHKVASRAWRIGQVVAEINPISAYAVTIASIVISSIEQAKERKKEESDEGSLVRE